VKLLIDTCISGSVRDALQTAGYDTVWTGDWPQDPGDDEILDHAHQQNRIVITLDKDFGELAVVHGRPHSGIIRLVNWSTQQQASTSLLILEKYSSELESGAIVTAEPGRVRVRPAIDPAQTS
jgi:predicted nuclease of predicted toxin-antitoxin system